MCKHGTTPYMIIGTRRFPSNLLQSGLELPGEYTSTSSDDILHTTRKHFMEERIAVSEIVLVQLEGKSSEALSNIDTNSFADHDKFSEDKVKSKYVITIKGR